MIPNLRTSSAVSSRPPLRGEEGRERAPAGAFPLPPEGEEVAPRSGDGVGEALRETHVLKQEINQ